MPLPASGSREDITRKNSTSRVFDRIIQEASRLPSHISHKGKIDSCLSGSGGNQVMTAILIAMSHGGSRSLKRSEGGGGGGVSLDS